MKARTQAEHLAVESPESRARQETGGGPFPRTEPFTGVRVRDPVAHSTEQRPAEPREHSKWRLQSAPEVMTSMLGALIGGS
jgi:hypothetical protein